MSDDLQVKGGVVGACPASPVTALSSADADQAASRLAPRGLQSTGADGKPRLRVLSSGWVRHDGSGLPPFLYPTDPVRCLPRGGNMSFMDGLPAGAFAGWKHTGFSGDVLFWRPA